MGAKGKRCSGENYKSLDNEWKDENPQSKGCMDRYTTRMCRPLRIFQFFTTLLLFSMLVYMTAMPFHHLTDLASILLIILTTSYLFFMAIDMISQFDSHGLPDSPMFLFSFFGMLLFVIAGSLLVHYPAVDNNFWALTLAKILCFIVSILFLIEVTMLLTYWRQKCATWKKCYPYPPPLPPPAAGGCGRREIRTLFSLDDGQEIDIEIGRCELATSTSNVEVPLETTNDDAVSQHGCRKISVGHRRTYVDSQSSVPELAVSQIAEAQTENEPTVITESQTLDTETRESIVQTNSKCELCHRSIDDGPLSPARVSSPPPSLDSQSQYSASPRCSQVPYPSQLPLTTELIPCNVPPPKKTEPRMQRSHCALCPAFLHVMREGISSPCCQSCNCGDIEHSRQHPAPYLLDQTGQQRHDLDVQSPHWAQRDPQQTPKSTSPLNPTESESPTTTNEKSDAERSDLVIEEGNRYRPTKKIARVYETRACPTHGAGLAARMAGLPEIVTKVSLSSICAKRNKRTQTRKKKDSSDSSDMEKKKVGDKILHGSTDTHRKEDTLFEKTIEGKRDSVKIKEMDYRMIEKIQDRTKYSEIIERSLEDRVKLIGEMDARKGSIDERKNSPRKLYRNSETSSRPTESARTTFELSERDVVSRGSSKKQSRESEQLGRIDTWLGDESTIKEEPDEEIELERTSIGSKFRRTIDIDESASPVVGGAYKKMTESSSLIDPRKSIISAGPILRLRLEKSADDLKIATGKSDEVIPRSKFSDSRSSLRSRSRGLPNITDLEIAMKNRQDSRPKSETGQIIRSPDSISGSICRERSVDSYRELCDCPSEEEEKTLNDETPTRLREEEKSEYVSSVSELDEENDEKSNSSVSKDRPTSRRVTRTKSILRKGGPS